MLVEEVGASAVANLEFNISKHHPDEMTPAISSRSKPSELAKLWMWAAAVAIAVLYIGSTILTPLYPLYRHEFGFSELIVTEIYAIYVVGNLTVLFFFGRLSDQIGRRRTTLLALAITALSYVVFPVRHWYRMAVRDLASVNDRISRWTKRHSTACVPDVRFDFCSLRTQQLIYSAVPPVHLVVRNEAIAKFHDFDQVDLLMLRCLPRIFPDEGRPVEVKFFRAIPADEFIRTLAKSSREKISHLLMPATNPRCTFHDNGYQWALK